MELLPQLKNKQPPRGKLPFVEGTTFYTHQVEIEREREREREYPSDMWKNVQTVQRDRGSVRVRPTAEEERARLVTSFLVYIRSRSILSRSGAGDDDDDDCVTAA